MIASLPNSTILDVEGKVKILGYQYPEILGHGITDNAWQIKMLFEMDGMNELGMLLDDGGLMLLEFRKDGGKRFFKHEFVEGKAIYHLAIGLYPTRVSIVLSDARNSVLMFRSWKALLSWLQDDKPPSTAPDVIRLPVAVSQLLGNLDSFAALLESGKVYNWSDPTSQAIPSTQPLESLDPNNPSTISALPSPTAEQPENPEPDLSALLSDIPSLPPPQPPSTRPLITHLPLPPISTITTHPSSTATAFLTTASQAYLLGPHPSPDSDIPSLPSLSSPTSPHPITLPNPNASIVSIVLGASHALALTSDSDLFSAGDGKAGQLGIGRRIFGMGAVGGPSREFHAHASAAEEFAEVWENVELGFLKEGGEGR